MMMIEISLIMMNDDDRNKPYYFIESQRWLLMFKNVQYQLLN